MTVQPCPVPSDALLSRYEAMAGAYTDAFTAHVPQTVDLHGFVDAFYTTPLFRVEKAILRLVFRDTGHNWDAAALRRKDHFAAWTVEARASDQILLSDAAEATRSWFCVIPDANGTTLYFGSAVLPKTGTHDLPFWGKALMGFHKVYSRALLSSAVRRLTRQSKPAS